MRTVPVLAVGGEAGSGISTAAAAMSKEISYDRPVVLADENAWLRRIAALAARRTTSLRAVSREPDEFREIVGHALDEVPLLGDERPNNMFTRSFDLKTRMLATWTSLPVIQAARGVWLDGVVGEAHRRGGVLILAAQHARERLADADFQASVKLDLHLACTDDIVVRRYFDRSQDDTNEQAWGEAGSQVWSDRNQPADPYAPPFYAIPYEPENPRSALINASRRAPFSPDNVAPVSMRTDGMTRESLETAARGLAILALA